MKRCVTIFEGPDCSGKTTAAQYVVSARGGILLHTGPTRIGGDARREYMGVAEWLRRNMVDGHVVFDRFHIGERVYGPVVRSVDTLGEAGQSEVETLLQSFASVLLIVCLPPREVGRREWERRRGDEMIGDAHVWEQTYDLYAEFLASRNTDLPVRVYDYTQNTLTQMLLTVRTHHGLVGQEVFA